MNALHLFEKAVYDTVDAMHACGVSTVSDLHDHEDANEHVKRLYDFLTHLLWDDDDPDPGMNVSLAICNAAQDMANVVMAQVGAS